MKQKKLSQSGVWLFVLYVLLYYALPIVLVLRSVGRIDPDMNGTIMLFLIPTTLYMIYHTHRHFPKILYKQVLTFAPVVINLVLFLFATSGSVGESLVAGGFSTLVALWISVPMLILVFFFTEAILGTHPVWKNGKVVARIRSFYSDFKIEELLRKDDGKLDTFGGVFVIFPMMAIAIAFWLLHLYIVTISATETWLSLVFFGISLVITLYTHAKFLIKK